MSKGIYCATVEIYVYAETQDEAQWEAARASTDYQEWDVMEVDALCEISEEWHECIPWGEGKEDRTVRQILEE